MGGAHSTSAVAPELIKAGDVLPTAELVERVKRAAWEAACVKAWSLGWPVTDFALGVIGMAPAVALMALTRLCPQVGARRLSRLLRLEPAQAAAAWTQADHAGAWAGEAAAGIVASIQDGEG